MRLSSGNHDDLVYELESCHKEIRTNYAKFVSRLCKHMPAQGVSVEELRAYVLKNVTDLEDKVKDRLQLASKVNNLFDSIGEGTTAFMTKLRLYQDIIGDFCTDAGFDGLEEYIQQLETYIDSINVKKFFKMIQPELKTFTDPFKDPCNDQKANRNEDLVKFKFAMARVLGLRPSEIQLFYIKKELQLVVDFAEDSRFEPHRVLWLKCDVEANISFIVAKCAETSKEVQGHLKLQTQSGAEKIRSQLSQLQEHDKHLRGLVQQVQENHDKKVRKLESDFSAQESQKSILEHTIATQKPADVAENETRLQSVHDRISTIMKSLASHHKAIGFWQLFCQLLEHAQKRTHTLKKIVEVSIEKVNFKLLGSSGTRTLAQTFEKAWEEVSALPID